MSLEARAPTKDRPAQALESLSFELLPTDDRDHLDLDTGEVFQDYGYARLDKNEQKLIGASITIRAASDVSDYQYNFMQYHNEVNTDDFDSPPSISFNTYVAPTTFSELASNIRSGLFPSTIMINFPLQFLKLGQNVAPIELGWEPDGSGMIWHNREHRAVPIESVRFYYTVVKPRYAEKIGLLPSEHDAPTDRTNETADLIQSSLAEIAKHVWWVATGVAVLAVLIVILILTRIG